MRKDWDFTAAEFDKFLFWLSPDRDQAAQKYEQIRRGLIAIFNSRCCVAAEELADETINRVMKRAQEMADTYVGDPAPYFYKVGHRLHIEYVKKNPPAPALDDAPSPVAPQPDDEKERVFACLEKCLQELDPDQRLNMLDYYAEDKRAKIDLRKAMANKMGIKVDNLRLQMFRLRERLEKCLENCLAQTSS